MLSLIGVEESQICPKIVHRNDLITAHPRSNAPGTVLEGDIPHRQRKANRDRSANGRIGYEQVPVAAARHASNPFDLHDLLIRPRRHTNEQWPRTFDADAETRVGVGGLYLDVIGFVIEK